MSVSGTVGLVRPPAMSPVAVYRCGMGQQRALTPVADGQVTGNVIALLAFMQLKFAYHMAAAQ